MLDNITMSYLVFMTRTSLCKRYIDTYNKVEQNLKHSLCQLVVLLSFYYYIIISNILLSSPFEIHAVILYFLYKINN